MGPHIPSFGGSGSIKGMSRENTSPLPGAPPGDPLRRGCPQLAALGDCGYTSSGVET